MKGISIDFFFNACDGNFHSTFFRIVQTYVLIFSNTQTNIFKKLSLRFTTHKRNEVMIKHLLRNSPPKNKRETDWLLCTTCLTVFIQLRNTENDRIRLESLLKQTRCWHSRLKKHIIMSSKDKRKTTFVDNLYTILFHTGLNVVVSWQYFHVTFPKTSLKSWLQTLNRHQYNTILRGGGFRIWLALCISYVTFEIKLPRGEGGEWAKKCQGDISMTDKNILKNHLTVNSQVRTLKN